jgi:hypothetical protein
MDHTPLLGIIGTLERPLILLLRGVLTVISVISSILAVSPVSSVDLSIILHPWGSLASWLQKSSPGFRSLYAHIGDCEQITHCLGIFHGGLWHSLDITDSVMKSIDDLDVLDIRASVSGIAEMFHVVLETFIVLLPDGLQGLCCVRTLICALNVSNEHGT